jgi:hypothetical protein
LAGKKHWENPYMNPKGGVFDSQMWYAGWCYGKQELSQLNKED